MTELEMHCAAIDQMIKSVGLVKTVGILTNYISYRFAVSGEPDWKKAAKLLERFYVKFEREMTK